MDNKFSINEQYKLFLQRMNLNESVMHPIQKKQLKQAFYGAFAQCIILMRDEISLLPEKEGVEILDSQIKEVVDFFNAETKVIKFPIKGEA